MYAKMEIVSIKGDKMMYFKILHSFGKNKKMENLIVIPENEKQLSLINTKLKSLASER